MKPRTMYSGCRISIFFFCFLFSSNFLSFSCSLFHSFSSLILALLLFHSLLANFFLLFLRLLHIPVFQNVGIYATCKLSTTRDICFAIYRRVHLHYVEIFLCTYVKRFPECYPSGVTFSYREHFRSLLRTASPPVGIQIYMKL